MKILRTESYVTAPWRNGGGTTREIAAFRDSSRHDDFLWRLSIATVAQSGPFSRFDGVDRTIALLDGEGMVLDAPAASVTVTRDTPPYTFSGETQISCKLLAGPTVDLNTMTRRGFFQHSLRRKQFVGWTTVQASAARTFIVSNGNLTLAGIGLEVLKPLDTLADLRAGEACRFYSERLTEIFIVELMPLCCAAQ
jgi:hypothetical protein